LVGWYGLFQLGHFFLNGFYLLDPGDPPFEPPPGGWHPQTVTFLGGVSFADWLNTILSFAFVYGYLRGFHWAAWLGTLTLTVSNYAALIFVWGTVAVGAQGLGVSYAWVTLPFIPVVLLFAYWCYWGASGRLSEVGAV
jgi:hypothetical protein